MRIQTKDNYGNHAMREKTNFDLYLEEQLKDPGFAERFEEAGEAWDIALQSTLRRPRQCNLT